MAAACIDHVPEQDDGIDIDAALAHVAASGSVVELADTEPISNEALLELDVDVLIPAALGGVISTANADRIQARMIVEAANHPITPDADDVLNDRGVTILPDILANAGGVTVSYFEWVQNIQQMRWEHEDVNHQLTRKMQRAYGECRDFRDGHDGGTLSLREAAFSLAVKRVADVSALRGYI